MLKALSRYSGLREIIEKFWFEETKTHDGESPGKSPEKGSQNLVLVERKRPREGG
jgi:hypothetical protein